MLCNIARIVLIAKLVREAILHATDRAILAEACRLKVLDSCQSCTLLESILVSAILVKLTVVLGISVIDTRHFVNDRVFILHRVLSQSGFLRLL